MLLALPDAVAFSSGSPVCEVNALPLVPMSPVLSDPAPSGWALTAAAPAYLAGQVLELSLRHPDPTRRARGVLIWTKSGPFSGAGSFVPALAAGRWRLVGGAMPDCGEWALTHADAMPRPLDALRFAWRAPPAGLQAVIARAFVIEDCGSPAGCRAAQALTPILVLDEAIWFDGFE